MKQLAIWTLLFISLADDVSAAITEYYTIDSSKSFVSYNALIKEVDRPDGAPEKTSLGTTITYLEYIPSGQLPISGKLAVILGREFTKSIEIEPIGVTPTLLPTELDFEVNLSAMVISDGLFPDNSWPSLPPGAICACFTSFNPLAPIINGSLSDEQLILDFDENGSFFNSSIPAHSYAWVGEPPQSPYTTNSSITYHIEASLVPIPTTLWLFMSSLSAIRFFKRNVALTS